MAIRRLDALVDAYSHLNGYHDPKSDAYQLRNPLLLKAFSPKHERDEQGRRRFPSFAAGYDNAILDARIKCMGKSFSKLTPDSTLTDLTCVYGNSAAAARAVKNFLRAALRDDSIMENQKLSWFLEDQKVKE